MKASRIDPLEHQRWADLQKELVSCGGLSHASVLQSLALQYRNEERISTVNEFQSRREAKESASGIEQSLWRLRFTRIQGESTNIRESKDDNLMTRYVKRRYEGEPEKEKKEIKTLADSVQDVIMKLSLQFNDQINDAMCSDSSSPEISVQENNPLTALMQLQAIEHNMKAIDRDILILESNVDGDIGGLLVGFGFADEEYMESGECSSSGSSEDDDESSEGDSSDEEEEDESSDDDTKCDSLMKEIAIEMGIFVPEGMNLDDLSSDSESSSDDSDESDSDDDDEDEDSSDEDSTERSEMEAGYEECTGEMIAEEGKLTSPGVVSPVSLPVTELASIHAAPSFPVNAVSSISNQQPLSKSGFLSQVDSTEVCKHDSAVVIVNDEMEGPKRDSYDSGCDTYSDGNSSMNGFILKQNLNMLLPNEVPISTVAMKHSRPVSDNNSNADTRMKQDHSSDSTANTCTHSAIDHSVRQDPLVSEASAVDSHDSVIMMAPPSSYASCEVANTVRHPRKSFILTLPDGSVSNMVFDGEMQRKGEVICGWGEFDVGSDEYDMCDDGLLVEWGRVDFGCDSENLEDIEEARLCWEAANAAAIDAANAELEMFRTKGTRHDAQDAVTVSTQPAIPSCAADVKAPRPKKPKREKKPIPKKIVASDGEPIDFHFTPLSVSSATTDEGSPKRNEFFNQSFYDRKKNCRIKRNKNKHFCYDDDDTSLASHDKEKKRTKKKDEHSEFVEGLFVLAPGKSRAVQAIMY